MIHPIYKKNNTKVKRLPDKVKTETWVEEIFYWIFSIGEQYSDYDFFLKKEKQLQSDLRELIDNVLTDTEKTQKIVNDFFAALEVIHSWLEADLETVFNFDPAAKSRS